jgi:hypothetical protein
MLAIGLRIAMEARSSYASNGNGNSSNGGGHGSSNASRASNKACFIFTVPRAKYRPVFPRDIDISGVLGLLLLTPFLHWLGIYVFFLPLPSQPFILPLRYPRHHSTSSLRFSVSPLSAGSLPRPAIRRQYSSVSFSLLLLPCTP